MIESLVRDEIRVLARKQVRGDALTLNDQEMLVAYSLAYPRLATVAHIRCTITDHRCEALLFPDEIVEGKMAGNVCVDDAREPACIACGSGRNLTRTTVVVFVPADV